jgi:hypothetical protein
MMGSEVDNIVMASSGTAASKQTSQKQQPTRSASPVFNQRGQPPSQQSQQQSQQQAQAQPAQSQAQQQGAPKPAQRPLPITAPPPAQGPQGQQGQQRSPRDTNAVPPPALQRDDSTGSGTHQQQQIRDNIDPIARGSLQLLKNRVRTTSASRRRSSTGGDIGDAEPSTSPELENNNNTNNANAVGGWVAAASTMASKQGNVSGGGGGYQEQYQQAQRQQSQQPAQRQQPPSQPQQSRTDDKQRPNGNNNKSQTSQRQYQDANDDEDEMYNFKSQQANSRLANSGGNNGSSRVNSTSSSNSNANAARNAGGNAQSKYGGHNSNSYGHDEDDRYGDAGGPEDEDYDDYDGGYGSSSHAHGGGADYDESAGDIDTGERVECPDCQRRFAPHSFPKHAKICAKVFMQKRKKFDSAKMRLSEFDELNDPTARKRLVKKTGSSNTQSAAHAQQSSSHAGWKEKSNAFREAMRAAREVSKALADGTPLPPPVISAPDPSLIQCPHCSRRFNDRAAERHIPTCQSIKAKPTGLKKGSGSSTSSLMNTRR